MNCETCGTDKALAVEDHLGGFGRDKYLWTSCINGHDVELTWSDAGKVRYNDWIEVR